MVVDIASFIRVEGVYYGISTLVAPWSTRIECTTSGGLFFLQRGSLWFEILDSGTPPVHIDEGSIIAVARGRTIVMRDTLQTPAPGAPRALPFELLGTHERAASPQCSARLLVARLPPESVQMDHAYPPVVIVRHGDAPHARLCDLLRLVEQESADGRDSAESSAIVQRLSEILVLELLRYARSSASEVAIAWTTAGQDRYIVRALALVHEHPERDWSVETLSRTVGLSRAAFAERFRDVVGEAPMSYVTRIRMRRAVAALQVGQQSLGAIAALVGYASETAFNRAFHRTMGVTPGKFRADLRRLSRQQSRDAH